MHKTSGLAWCPEASGGESRLQPGGSGSPGLRADAPGYKAKEPQSAALQTRFSGWSKSSLRVTGNTPAQMRISAKADYAVRAMVELAATVEEKPIKAERIATAQDIPLNFLENILGELRHAGLVRSHRGAEGGFRLARNPSEISVADVIRAVDGPLASVRGAPPEESEYKGASEALPRVWIAVRANLRRVVEHVTVADIALGKIPKAIDKLADDPDVWKTR
jgi:Rrf2 family protein